MLKENVSISTTFVIRLWLERSGAGARWRGSIEHIPSGRRGMFLGWEELQKYFLSFDIRLKEVEKFRSEEQEGHVE